MVLLSGYHSCESEYHQAYAEASRELIGALECTLLAQN